jgi:hypothetical protein
MAAEIKETTFTHIDNFLIGLYKQEIYSLTSYHPYILDQKWYYLFRQILTKYHLIGWNEGDKDIADIVYIAENGVRVLSEEHGIRSYLLKNDPDVFFKDGYPRVIAVTRREDGVLLARFLIEDANEESVMKACYAGQDCVFDNFQNCQGSTGNYILTVSTPPAEAKEGPWTRTGVIVAIVFGIVATLGVYFAWLGLHPGK